MKKEKRKNNFLLKSRKAIKKDFKLMKALLSQERTEALEKLSLLEEFHMALALKEHSQFTAHLLTMLKLFVRQKQREQNSTTFAI